MKQTNWASILLAIVMIGAFLLYMVAFEVPFTHTAVVTTFGKITRTITQPGLHWKLPWPIEQASMFDNRIRVDKTRLEQLFTADEQSITVTTYITWRIAPQREAVKRYLEEFGSLEDAQLVLLGLVHDAMGKVVGEHPFEHLVSTDPKKMQFENIEQQVKDLIASQALEDYGIEVVTAGIQRLSLPEEATKKVFQRMREERQQLAKKYRAQGASQAQLIRAEANRLASEIENRATAEAINIRGEGDAQAAKYYKIFAQHPQLHSFLKRLETLKQILPKQSTLILEASSVPPFDLLGIEMLEPPGKEPAGSQTDQKDK